MTQPYASFEQLYIAGKWRAGGSKPKPNLNPWTEEVLFDAPQGNVDDLNDAYEAARTAQPDWAAKLPSERAQVFAAAAKIMEARRDEIIGWLVREAGSTLLKAALEWKAVYGVMLEAASLPYMVEGRILPNDTPGKESRVYRKPVGVVGVISPWNFPHQLSARSIAPTMAVGNAVVLKPASDTPVTGGLWFAKLFEEAGLPGGVLNVISGSGGEIGDAFVGHRVPRVISFTGSTPVGRGIGKAAYAADIIKRLELELGGDSPLVVLADADLDLAVKAAVFGKYLHQGQICMIANRLVVEAPIYDAFVDRFAAAVQALPINGPDDPTTMIGPIINRGQLESVQELIGKARDAGYRQLAGGDADGLVLPPHAFADVAADGPLHRQEIFGPMAPIIRATDEADALRIANDTDYGLSSAVFTRDLEKGVRFARSIEAGMAHVNDQPVNDLPFSPFGGDKNSGIGRFNGRWAVDAFTTDQWVTVQHQPRAYPTDARQLSPAEAASVGG
ncbi:aldehyde dehydrogenase family protein [Sphingomonas sp. S1-29]|uniref:aldehyde dehydrogenase family protein n=1 Tax=Sphingomonas sp. S1-29 TaxID=2991074 RepID=UPI002240CEB2|nr:aldehyde dehydrogenase family protein [Sphingomonas sp. S1-29]UZK70905.1 aldehyde dehydrogenase family protein [Sphingomonas sp. S1-29]